MSEKKIPLAEATEPQLRAFAETYLGITMPGNARLETIRAKVSTAWNKDEIIVTVADTGDGGDGNGDGAPTAGTPPRPATTAQKAKAAEAAAPDKVRIIISRTEESGGDEAVPVGVNGKVMLIPRGEECSIPRPYFEVLKNAVKHIYDPLKEGGINPIPRRVPMYPFQVLSA